MFKVVKAFKKEDLKWVLEEIGEEMPATVTIATLKQRILNSKEYGDDPEFVQTLLESAIAERKLEEEKMKLEKEEKQEKMELEKEKEEGKMRLDKRS